MERPSKHVTMLRIANVIAERSTCSRTKVGAVITPSDMSTIVSMGYNGAPRLGQNACPNDPQIPGNCGCVHAEANALIKAPYIVGYELKLFCTLSPCESCARLIVNSQVREVVFSSFYRSPEEGLLVLLRGNVQLTYRTNDGFAGIGDEYALNQVLAQTQR